MHARHFPPGRSSPSLTGIVNPFGADQCLSFSGSVHACQTNSRGASNTRLITSSCSLAVIVLLSLPDTFPPFGLNFLQVAVQLVEAVLPIRAVMLDPVGDTFQRLCLEAARPPLRLTT